MKEDKEILAKRLLYQSWYRGCKETDKILGSFSRQYVPSFSAAALAEYENIMQESDKDIFDWLTGKKHIPAKYENSKVMKLLLAFKYSESNL